VTEKTQLPEVLGGAEEQEGKPIPDVSEASAEAKPSSQQVDMDALAAKLADKILPRFEDQARKRAQSVFDKTGYQFETMAEYLKASGGDPKKAAREMALDQVAQREMNQLPEPKSLGRDEGEDAETRTAKFLNDLKDESGMELSDEELREIWNGKRYTNYEAAYKDARKAAWKKAKQANIGAGAVSVQPGSSVSSVDDEDLTKELAAIQAGKRGSPSSPENKTRRAEIKAKLAATRR